MDNSNTNLYISGILRLGFLRREDITAFLCSFEVVVI